MTYFSNVCLVDESQGITIAPQDGRKARMPGPGRIVSFQDNSLSTFTMGDATYAYNTGVCVVFTNNWARNPYNAFIVSCST